MRKSWTIVSFCAEKFSLPADQGKIMKTGKIMKSIRSRVFGLLLAFSLCTGVMPVIVQAEDGAIEVEGDVYEFGEKSSYPFHKEDAVPLNDGYGPYGAFSISGNIADVSQKDGVPSYELTDGGLKLFYNHSDTLLNADLDNWHLVSDKSKKVGDVSLKSDIRKGALIIQTSKDRKNWITAASITNAFSDTPIRTDPVYSATDVELINGCFYRVIAAYELGIRTRNSKFWFINNDKYDHSKFAEVYEFYAFKNAGDGGSGDSGQTYSLGSRVRTANFDGYSGSSSIGKSDPHYGWDLGHFFVSGYTSETEDDNGNKVFLKNVGDRVTLWFRLDQDINALNGKKNLKITADHEGYDQGLETPRMDFGRGALMIRYTDHNNVSSEPTIYANYLEANTTAGADTRVQLFEEGDYEVTLDYQITSDELIDKTSHYRINFKFAIRNGNCMAFPFDIETNAELTNSSMTESGFRLDLAKSRYLKVNIKREVMADSADGLVEDTRFNGPAKEGAEYTDEGIYTISVKNDYTDQLTVKKIYVGRNNIMKAYMLTGLSIPEINTLIEQGAIVSDDGTIRIIEPEPAEEPSEETEQEQAVPEDEETEEKSGLPLPVVIGALVIFLIITGTCGYSIYRKKRRNSDSEDDSEEDDLDPDETNVAEDHLSDSPESRKEGDGE